MEDASAAEGRTVTTHQTITSITTEQGRPTDVYRVRDGLVSEWTWIGMSARMINVLATGDGFLEEGLIVDIYPGSVARPRRLVIKLNQADLYDIEIGDLHRSIIDPMTTSEWVPVAQTRDIQAEDLDQAIRDLYDAHKV